VTLEFVAADGTAKRWSDWDAAIADDSAAGEQRSELADRREVEAVAIAQDAMAAAH
jgi:hypothetical protein